MTDYTKSTNFAVKDTLPTGDPGKVIKGTEMDAEFNNIQTSNNSKANKANSDLTGTTVIATASVTGNITVGGTVDGRDVAADGTKLNTIEPGATADQTNSEIKVAYEANADTNAYTDASVTKLGTIETSADVTDVTNVTAAGALMDSEMTDIAAVKAINQGVATTDSPTFVNLTATSGINLGGTAAANKLDDYEEGTFTPTIFGSTTTGTPSYSSQVGDYTKIGDRVLFNILVQLSSGANTLGGDVKIGGLPFTAGSQSSPCSIGQAANLIITSGTSLACEVKSSSSFINMLVFDSGGGTTNLIPAEITGNTLIRIAGQYKV
jgi:hypothetical protein|tara:strand:+ start:21 stop:986 length:966 start_codon:yes stop_codon:yes gene_type:complete